MLISCAVVAYKNPPEQIARVLACIAKSSVKITSYLVDNSPTDALADVARLYGAHYLHLPANPGFGSAHNRAIQAALEMGSGYHAVLNPDIYFEADAMAALLEYMAKHQDVGLLMPGIRYPDGKTQHLCKLLPSPTDLFMRRFLPNWYARSGRLAKYEMHESGYDKIMNVPALSGCFMLIRTSILQKCGGFDERYFMYLEDVDLSRRLGSIARNVYFPHVSIVHDYAKGSYKNRKLLFHHIRSAILYFNKWGWLFDAERKRINTAALLEIQKSDNTIYKMVK